MPPRKNQGLTERQNEAYEFIRDEIRLRRKPPTIKELCEHLDVASPNAAWKLLKALETKGWIERDPQAPRGIRLVGADADGPETDDELDLPQLPLISRTSSTEPEKLRRSRNRLLTIDTYFLGFSHPDDCLFCRAGDDGMHSAGFNKGDFVIVEEQAWEDIPNETIVAALVRETVLIRYFDFANDTLHLRPSERSYSERTFTRDDNTCYIIGPVLGVIRTFKRQRSRDRRRR